jgi:hypothetical protein
VLVFYCSSVSWSLSLSLILFVLHLVLISEISEVFVLKEPTAEQNICWWQVEFKNLKITSCEGKISDVSWLSQGLLGGSSTKNLLPKAIIGKILSSGARKDGHSLVIFSKTTQWPNLVRVNSAKQFSL